MDRRSFLWGLTTLALAQTACQSRDRSALKAAVLKGSLPPQVAQSLKGALAEQSNARIRLTARDSLVELFEQLQQWHQTALAAADESNPGNPADWVGLSDYWLWAAIQQELIRPIADPTMLAGWQDLPETWSTLLRRDRQGQLTAQGSLWATPYRWGYLTVVFNRSRFERLGWQPTEWSDLLRPDLARRISLPNHPRIVLGMLLKSVGASANQADPTENTALVDAIAALQSQVRVYASDYYLQSLIVGDVWLAVGWSTDVLPLLSRYRQLAAVAPAPGTLLSADVWVKPNLTAEMDAIDLSAIDQRWLSYWWEPDVTVPMSLFSHGVSPRLLSASVDEQYAEIAQLTTLPAAEVLRNSEFIEPLPAAAIANYTQLWQQLRGSK